MGGTLTRLTCGGCGKTAHRTLTRVVGATPRRFVCDACLVGLTLRASQVPAAPAPGLR